MAREDGLSALHDALKVSRGRVQIRRSGPDSISRLNGLLDYVALNAAQPVFSVDRVKVAADTKGQRAPNTRVQRGIIWVCKLVAAIRPNGLDLFDLNAEIDGGIGMVAEAPDCICLAHSLPSKA